MLLVPNLHRRIHVGASGDKSWMFGTGQIRELIPACSHHHLDVQFTGIMPRIKFLKNNWNGWFRKGKTGGGGEGGGGGGALLVLRKALYKALLVQSAKSLSSACFL